MTRLPEKHTGKNHTVKIIEYNTENTYLYLHIFFSNTYLSSNCTAWTNLWFTTQLPKEFVVFKLFFLIVNDARHSKRFKSRRSLRSKEKSPARTRLGSDFSFSSFFHGRPKRCLLASFIYAYWSCVYVCQKATCDCIVSAVGLVLFMAVGRSTMVDSVVRLVEREWRVHQQHANSFTKSSLYGASCARTRKRHLLLKILLFNERIIRQFPTSIEGRNDDAKAISRATAGSRDTPRHEYGYWFAGWKRRTK